MEKEYLIKKWLDNDLNAEETEAFNALDDYETLLKISNLTKTIEPPSFNSEDELTRIKNAINSKKTSASKNWLSPLLKIAAILAICFGVYQFTSNTESNFTTVIAQKDKIKLPDNSIVSLNALSSLAFSKDKWNTNRNVSLSGEAFFDVAKGANFNVNTNHGIITVYGTKFNVKVRENYFEVVCYEGLVGVSYNGNEVKLKPGDSFLVLNDKIIPQNKNNTNHHPVWLDNESIFNSIPYGEVLAEFERQYDLTIISKNIDLDQLFTGGFSHKNIEIAIKAITLPLQLTYKKEGNTITLKRD